jgi:hypothetical protein
LSVLNLKNTGANESTLYSLGTSVRHLNNLNLSFNKITNLENLFLQSSSIEVLNLSFNSINSFSTKYLPKASLKVLSLADNKIKEFDFTGDFPNLTTLNLNNNLHLYIDKKYKNNTILPNLDKNNLLPKNLVLKFFTDKEELNLVNKKFIIEEKIKLKYKKLISLILQTESMDDKERQYWFDILPTMTESQSNRLYSILDIEKKKLNELKKKYTQEIKDLNEGYYQQPIKNNDYSVIDTVNIPYGKCALIVKSENTITKVKDFIVNSTVKFNTNELQVFLSNNGWYGISLALVDELESKNILFELKQAGKIPNDSFCSTGKSYIKEVELKF